MLLSLTAPLRYYTTRELSNHAAEIWMLRALGDEIMDNGSGPNDHGYRNVGGGSGGAYDARSLLTSVLHSSKSASNDRAGRSWLQEHLQSNYSVCWSTPSADSAPGIALPAMTRQRCRFI